MWPNALFNHAIYVRIQRQLFLLVGFVSLFVYTPVHTHNGEEFTFACELPALAFYTLTARCALLILQITFLQR